MSEPLLYNSYHDKTSLLHMYNGTNQNGNPVAKGNGDEKDTLEDELDKHYGMIYCTDGNSCYASGGQQITGDTHNIDSYRIGPNRVLVTRNVKSGKSNSTSNHDETIVLNDAAMIGDTNLSVDYKTANESQFRRAIWAPVMDPAYIKMNCCLGNYDGVKDSNGNLLKPQICGDFNSNDDKNVGNCNPFLTLYCQENKMPKPDYQDVNPKPLPPLPRGSAGCYSFNPMHDNINNGWINETKRKGMNTKEKCLIELPAEMAKFNLGIAEGVHVLDDATLPNYTPAVVFWKEEDSKNPKGGIMNTDTTDYDKKYCGCTPDSVEEQKETINKFLKEYGIANMPQLNSKPLCNIPYCGSRYRDGIPWDPNDIIYQQGTNCDSGPISLSICNINQEMKASAEDAAQMAGINAVINCKPESIINDGSTDGDSTGGDSTGGDSTGGDSTRKVGIPSYEDNNDSRTPSRSDNDDSSNTTMIVIVVFVIVSVIGVVAFFMLKSKAAASVAYQPQQYQPQQYQPQQYQQYPGY